MGPIKVYFHMIGQKLTLKHSLSGQTRLKATTFQKDHAVVVKCSALPPSKPKEFKRLSSIVGREHEIAARAVSFLRLRSDYLP